VSEWDCSCCVLGVGVGGFDLVLCLFCFFIVGEGGGVWLVCKSWGLGWWGRRRKADGVVVFARTRKALDYGKECMSCLKRDLRRKMTMASRLWSFVDSKSRSECFG